MTVPIPAPGQILHWLGGPVDVRVEVDTGAGEGFGGLWDTALWDVPFWGSRDPDWYDVTEWVERVQIVRGSERWGERMVAGSASITLDNQSGIFTPDLDVPDPFARPFRPGRRIRVVAIPDDETGTRQPLFTGRLDASIDDYTPGGDFVTATVNAIDYMGEWSAFNPLATSATGVQRTDQRVAAALDRYEWDADDRDLQTGVHNVQSSDLAQSTLEECQRAADAEGGIFYCDKDGLAVFKSRDWLTTDARSITVQGYVGYDDVPAGAQAAHVLEVSTSWELARVTNIVHFARVGGTMQTAEDEASKNSYRPRTYQRSDLQCASDGEALALAVKYLNARKDLRMRVDAVTIAAVEDPDNDDLNRLVWDVRFGDRLAIRINGPAGTIDRETHVTGMAHVITADDWTVAYRLDDAETLTLSDWILESPEFGVLGETTRLAA